MIVKCWTKRFILSWTIAISIFTIISAMQNTAKARLPFLSSTNIDHSAPAKVAIMNPALVPPKQSQKINEDPKHVLARVGDFSIRVSDVSKLASTLPEELKKLPKEILYPTLVKQIAWDKAVQLAAYKEKINQIPEVKTAIQTAVTEAIQQTLVKNYFILKLRPFLTPQAIQNYYEKHYLNQPQLQEIHLQQIIVQTPEIAQQVIKKLKQGKSFSALAGLYSIDRNNAIKNGGDIGWFTKQELEPPLQQATFSLHDQQFNSVPLQTTYGWVITKRLAIRNRSIPPLAKVENEIRQQITTEKVDTIYQEALQKVHFIDYEQ